MHAIARDPRYRISLGKTDGRRVRAEAMRQVTSKHAHELQEDEKRVSLLRHCLEAAARSKVEGIRFQGKPCTWSVADVIAAYFVCESRTFHIPVLTNSRPERIVLGRSYEPSPQDVRGALGLYFRSARRRLSSRAPFDFAKFRRRWKSDPRRNGALTRLPRLSSTASAFEHKAYNMQLRWIENQRQRLRSLLDCYASVRNALIRLTQDVEASSRSRRELSDTEWLIMRSFFRRDLGEHFE